jgi:hypothetical protein
MLYQPAVRNPTLRRRGLGLIRFHADIFANSRPVGKVLGGALAGRDATAERLR